MPGVGPCWGLVDDTTADRLSAPSDYLAAEATRGLSPNTICRRASTLAEYFQWAADVGIDPMAPQSQDLNNYLSALQSTRKRHPLSDPILTMPGDDRRRSASTVAERVRDVKDFVGWSRDRGYVADKTAEMVKNWRTPRAPKGSVPRLSAAQRVALAAAELSPRDRFLVELLSSGLRKGEALGLLVQDWHPDAALADLWACPAPMWGPHLHVVNRDGQPRDKRAKLQFEPGRIVPIFPELRRAKMGWDAWRSQNLPQSVECASLVQTTHGPTAGMSMSSSAVDRIFTKVLPSADPVLEGVTPHVLRHEFASQCFDAGIERILVMAWLGHLSPESTFVYTDPDEDALHGATKALQAHRAALGGRP